MKLSRQAAIGIRVMEECNELAQRVSKALLFGIEERQPGQDLTNRERIYQEFFDLRAVLGMFGIDAWVNNEASKLAERHKCEKVERFIHYAIDRGEQLTLDQERSAQLTESVGATLATEGPIIKNGDTVRLQRTDALTTLLVNGRRVMAVRFSPFNDVPSISADTDGCILFDFEAGEPMDVPPAVIPPVVAEAVDDDEDAATKDDLLALLGLFDGSATDLMERGRFLRLSKFLNRAVDAHLGEK